MCSRLALLLCLLVCGPAGAAALGKADHVVLVVWDGMRPDFVTPQYTPTLYELAKRGTFFLRHHAVYVSTTEVNGAALATGLQPEHSGIIANTEYRPEFSWLNAYGTEALDVVRRGDMASGGHYLQGPTVAELLHAAGFPTVVAGAKPIALLHDRAPRKTTEAEKQSVTLFRGLTLPRSTLDALVKNHDIGAFPGPAPAPSASAIDAWTTKALLRGLWKNGIPKFTVLWLSEPDSAQHASGPGSDAALAALESSDDQLAAVLKALEEKNALGRTDLFVVSDHAFSTVGRGPDVIASLKKSKFTAAKQFQNPEPGDILVNILGGTTFFYVFEHDEQVIRRLVTYLQGTDFAGVVFCALPLEGTFPLAQVHLAAENGAPDVAVSMRWTAETSEHGPPGMLTVAEGTKGHGSHGSLSPFDLHNTLVAAGPDLKRGFVNDLPSGNVDVAPTILSILGVSPPSQMDGRVLVEALVQQNELPPKAAQQTLEASRDLGFLTWHQYLKLTRVGSAVYYDEGNGEARLKQESGGK